MFTIKKTGENHYLASLKTNQDSLGRIECNHLKHEIQQLIKPNREISINLKDVKSINREGFRILEEMKRLADQKNSRISFINVDPPLSINISKLTKKKPQYHDELEEF